MNNPLSLCNGLNRREVLRVGALTSLGVSVLDLVRTRTLAADAPRAKSCILVWLDGGPSHLETFDLKPNAPTEVRGPFQAIPTSVAGVSISECLPGLAQRMDKLAVICSMTSPLGEHNFGTHYLQTGYKPTPVLEYPTFGSVVAHQRKTKGILPANIAIPAYRVGGANLTGAGYLPTETRPFSVGGDPAKPGFRVRDLAPLASTGLTLDRLKRRQQFAREIDRLTETLDSSGGIDPQMAQAFDLTTNATARKAFELDDETPETRRRYGSKTVGQSCLLARRLAERGVPFVTVNHRGWDTHEQLYTRLKEGYTGAKKPVGLIPSLDLALSGLLDDLQDRRLLDETLVVVMGEFGRTPKLNSRGGRDHWPRVFSVALAGGGIRGGQVIGASDAVGESPQDRPVTPSDLARTIYTLLGIDPDLELATNDGRRERIALPGSEVVSELIG